MVIGTYREQHICCAEPEHISCAKPENAGEAFSPSAMMRGTFKEAA